MESKSARDYVSEEVLWHLTAEVAAAMLPSDAEYSQLPRELDLSAPPLSSERLHKIGAAKLSDFIAFTKLPAHMHDAEASALQTLSMALSHANESNRCVDAVKATSAAYKALYKGSLDIETKKRMCSYLKKQAVTMTAEERMGVAHMFMHSFEKAAWPAGAMRYADSWQSTFRTSRDDAEKWSSFLFLQAASGAFESDPAYVGQIVSSMCGKGGGVASKYERQDALVAQVKEMSERRTAKQIALAAEATLLQSTKQAEKSGAEILKFIKDK